MKWAIYKGFKGCDFQRECEIDTWNHAEWLNGIVKFLAGHPEINDMAWTLDDGTSYVIRRLPLTDAGI